MSPRKPKVKPAALAHSSGKRQPKALPRPGSNDQRLTVSFHHVDRTFDGPWRWPAPGEPDAWEILDFLCQISALTWGEIMAQGTGPSHKRHKKHHSYPIEGIGDAAQARLAELHLDEVTDELFRFRLSGVKRLWGFRIEDTFHVLWWDPNHQVCPTERN